MTTPDELRKFGPVKTDHHEEEPEGQVKVLISYVKAGDRKDSLVAPDGTVRTIGIPIEELRQRFGGRNSGNVTDPWGQKRLISLDPELPDGEGIFVKITYRFRKKNHP